MPRWLGLAPAHSRNCRAESLSQSILETSAPPNSANWNWSARRDRKSTRLNSSHGYISYAVFCLKKKKMHVIGGALVIGFIWGPGAGMWKTDPERYTNLVEVSSMFLHFFDLVRIFLCPLVYLLSS